MGLETGTATIIAVLEATSDEEDSLSSELNEFTLSSAELVPTVKNWFVKSKM